MCGFILTDKVQDKGLSYANEYVRRRGPDESTTYERDGWSCIHDLLWITGEKTTQPIISEGGDLWCLYNGEVYDYRDRGDFSSDGRSILAAYEESGPRFVSDLDGEFAIALLDWSKGILILSSDTFATKPIWYAQEEGRLGAASYASALYRLGFRFPKKLSANTFLVFDIHKKIVLESGHVTQFDLKQHRRDYSDWISAFDDAVRKRTHTERGIFLGVSEGYDSGAIMASLLHNDIGFAAYSVVGEEDQSVVSARQSMHDDFHILSFTKSQYKSLRKELRSRCENFSQGKFSVYRDKASYGLAAICRVARKNNQLVYLSGQGADEIISDYGMMGRPIYKHSQLHGVYPKDLHRVFPWRNFFGGTQICYLMKEEYVSGSYGIETRYPFLDRRVVQEFLWLDPRLKNCKYKAPINAYLVLRNFPFHLNVKMGFRADVGLK